MDATIKATPNEVIVRVGGGSIHVTRYKDFGNEQAAEVKVFLAGGRELMQGEIDPAFVDAVCVLVGEAHAGR
jgi:tryptophan synthase beta subunit